MTHSGESSERFALREGPSIELDAAGFLHPRTARSKQSGFTRYVELTHIACSETGIWIASEDDLIIVPSKRFEAPDGAARLRDSLTQRVANQAGGAESLARMQAIDAIGSDEGTPHAVRALMLVCVAAYAAQHFFHPEVLFRIGFVAAHLNPEGDLFADLGHLHHVGKGYVDR